VTLETAVAVPLPPKRREGGVSIRSAPLTICQESAASEEAGENPRGIGGGGCKKTVHGFLNDVAEAVRLEVALSLLLGGLGRHRIQVTSCGETSPYEPRTRTKSSKVR
jgi:hypothetical protein